MDIKIALLDLKKLHGIITGKRLGYEVAEKIGVSRNTIQRWLTGESMLTLDSFNAICQAIGMDADNFIVFERKMKEEEPRDEDNNL